MKLSDVSCFMRYCHYRYTGNQIDNTRLWILLYMAQCWHIRGYENALFEGTFRRSVNGPVLVEDDHTVGVKHYDVSKVSKEDFEFLMDVFIATMDCSNKELLEMMCWKDRDYTQFAYIEGMQMRDAMKCMPSLRTSEDYIDDMPEAGYINGIGPAVLPERYMDHI